MGRVRYAVHEQDRTVAGPGTVPLPTPAPSHVPFVKNVNVTPPVGSNPAPASVTVALSWTLVPNATDEPIGITASVALLCSSVAVDDAAVFTWNGSHGLVDGSDRKSVV